VNELLAGAAGKIDPFQRPFGMKMELVRIQEKGLY
jgi:hypothetical protein